MDWKYPDGAPKSREELGLNIYELKVDGVVVYKGNKFPPYPTHDICSKLARHFGVSFEHTCNGSSYSY